MQPLMPRQQARERPPRAARLQLPCRLQVSDLCAEYDVDEYAIISFVCALIAAHDAPSAVWPHGDMPALAVLT